MLRRLTSEKNPADWFEMAEERLRACDSLWKHEGLTFSGVEGLQEAVERYLKGYLVAMGWFHDFAEELTADFFAQHYPGEDLTNVGANYEKLRADAGELISEIKRKLPKFFPPT